jgi:hypothetical protein
MAERETIESEDDDDAEEESLDTEFTRDYYRASIYHPQLILMKRKRSNAPFSSLSGRLSPWRK